MNLIARTRDIIAANVSDLLDRAENPAKMIRLIVTEMEETLAELQSGDRRARADQLRMQGQIARLVEIGEAWTRKAELALANDREDLARAALLERTRTDDLRESLAIEIQVLSDAVRAADEDTSRVAARLEEARSREAAILARSGASHAYATHPAAASRRRVEAAFERFDQLEQRVATATRRAEAADAPLLLESQIAELETEQRAEAALAELKARRAASLT